MTDHQILIAAIIGAAVLWIAPAMLVAYSAGDDFSFFALFICGFLLGWPLVLLGVTLAKPIVRASRKTQAAPLPYAEQQTMVR